MTDMVLPGSGPYTKSVTRSYSIPALAKDAQAGTAGFRLKASISDLTSDFFPLCSSIEKITHSLAPSWGPGLYRILQACLDYLPLAVSPFVMKNFIG